MTAARIEELEAEVAYWKAEAQHNASNDVSGRIGRAFGLTAAEAWVMATLYGAKGKIVRKERLLEDIPGCDWEARHEASNVIQVLVCRIRKKFGRDAIETAPSFGYRLSSDAQWRIDQVVL